jgi:hypothetical protein
VAVGLVTNRCISHFLYEAAAMMLTQLHATSQSAPPLFVRFDRLAFPNEEPVSRTLSVAEYRCRDSMLGCILWADETVMGACVSTSGPGFSRTCSTAGIQCMMMPPWRCAGGSGLELKQRADAHLRSVQVGRELEPSDFYQ